MSIITTMHPRHSSLCYSSSKIWVLSNTQQILFQEGRAKGEAKREGKGEAEEKGEGEKWEEEGIDEGKKKEGGK